MQRRPARILTRTLVALAIACALLGCGQRGKLYLPNQKKKVPAPPTQPNTQPNTPP